MSYSEGYDGRCMNCGGFHGYGNCPYYDDQSWGNQPNLGWEGDEDFNPWNPPHHQYYGEHEYQPLEQEEPHQGQGNRGKKSIEELFEEFMIRTEDNCKALSDGNNAQEAKLMQVSARGCVQCGSPHCGERCLETIAEEEARFEAAVQERLAQRLKEGFMDRIERNCKDAETKNKKKKSLQ